MIVNDHIIYVPPGLQSRNGYCCSVRHNHGPVQQSIIFFSCLDVEFARRETQIRDRASANLEGEVAHGINVVISYAFCLLTLTARSW